MPVGRRQASCLAAGCVILVLTFWIPPDAGAVDWPWKKKPPDEVTARCVIEPAEVEQGFPGRLRPKVEAADSRSHPLAYVWSTNGGVLTGTGPAVEMDASQLNPGVYSVSAAVQDAYSHGASCVADFRVAPRPDSLAMSCSSGPEVVEPGARVEVRAEATDLLGHPLRYRWFANAGTIEGEGSAVQLDTSGLRSGLYTITGRVEDGLGGASDCVITVKVEIPPLTLPPPPPPEPLNIAQVLFARNREAVEPTAQSQLKAVLERLRTERSGRVSLESYADPAEQEPQKLAAARAETVKRYLLENGVPESQIATVVGLGGKRGGLRNRTLDIIWLPDGVQY